MSTVTDGSDRQITVEQIRQLAVILNTDPISIGGMVPYSGTHVYEMAHKGETGYRLISANGEDYDRYCGQALEIK